MPTPKVTPEMSVAITELREGYNRLSPWKRRFFPSVLSKALQSYELDYPITAHSVYHAFFNKTWFFQRIFFSCLRVFSKAKKPSFLIAVDQEVSSLVSAARQLPQEITAIDFRNDFTGDISDYPKPITLFNSKVRDYALSRGRNGANWDQIAATIFMAVPPHVTELNFGSNEWHFNHFRGSPLIFAALRENITKLSLANNSHGGCRMYGMNDPNMHFSQLFVGLPPLEILDLSWNNLHFLRPEALENFALPQIESIDLSGNWQDLTTGVASLGPILKKINPDSIRSVNLSDNSFGIICADPFAMLLLHEMLGLLPPTLRTLFFKRNLSLKINKTMEYNLMERTFAVFPRELEELDISENEIPRHFTQAEIHVVGPQGERIDRHTAIQRAARALPEHLRYLNLADNSLATLGGLLIVFIENLPRSLERLNLAGNSLSTLGELLPVFIENLPRSLERLDLRRNHLWMHSALFIGNLPPALRELDLRENQLHLLSVDKLKTWGGRLNSVTRVLITYEECNLMHPDLLETLRGVIPAENIHLIDKNGIKHQLLSGTLDLRDPDLYCRPTDEIIRRCADKELVLIPYERIMYFFDPETNAHPNSFDEYRALLRAIPDEFKALLRAIPPEKIRFINTLGQEMNPFPLLSLLRGQPLPLKVSAAFFVRHNPGTIADRQQLPRDIAINTESVAFQARHP